MTLDIGTLHLPGWERHEQERLVEAFHGELQRLAAERGLPERLAMGGSMLNLDAVRFDAAHDATPEQAGAGAAAQVMQSMRESGK